MWGNYYSLLLIVDVYIEVVNIVNSLATIDNNHSGWTPFHPMYENSTLCTMWFVRKPTRDITVNIFSARFFLFPQGFFYFRKVIFYFRKVCFISARFVLFPQGLHVSPQGFVHFRKVCFISARLYYFRKVYFISARFILFPQGYFNFRENIFNGNHQGTARPRSFGVMARFEQ